MTEDRDHQLVAVWFGRYYRRLVGFLMKQFHGTLSVEDVRDLAQQTFTNLLQKIGQFEGGPEAEWAYVKTAAKRLGLNQIERGKDRLHDAIEKAPEAGDHPQRGAEAALIANESAAAYRVRLNDAIDALPTVQRQVVTLRRDGRTNPEIERILRKTPDAVRSAYSDAIPRLRKLLGNLPPELNLSDISGENNEHEQ